MLRKVISGGQTGVDQGALNWAITNNIPHGGHCPRGRKSERGKIPECFNLIETASADYWERTVLNVQNADATLLITRGYPSGGTASTMYHCKRTGKPYLVADVKRLELICGTLQADCKTQEDLARYVANWLWDMKVEILNVAGPRDSKQPDIGLEVKTLMDRVLEAYRKSPLGK